MVLGLESPDLHNQANPQFRPKTSTFHYSYPSLFSLEVFVLLISFIFKSRIISPKLIERNKIELRKMSSLGTSKGVLEIAKFAVYVSVPIGLMYFFASNTKNLQKVMGNRQYVVYPPEAPRPPSPEEMREMAREIARNRDRK